MTFPNPNWQTQDGTALGGQVPTAEIKRNDLAVSPELRGAVANAYKGFADSVRWSCYPKGSHSREFRLEGGAVARMTSVNGVMRVHIWPVGGGGSIELPMEVYMESGQLEWSWPGEQNPTRLEPARWHFLDIPFSDPVVDKYLGEIYAQRIEEKKLGQQKGKKLTEGMDSKALGYPKIAYPDGASTAQRLAIDAANAALAERYSEATVIKKITAGYFPPSLYSGKLRMFVQAQFGAKENLTGLGLRAEVFGTSAILMYRGKNGTSVQFGLWSHHSPGLLTAIDGSYWFLTIRNPSGLNYVVNAYAIVHAPEVKYLVEKLKSGKNPLSAEDREKAEAYVFAYSAIDTEHPRIVGEFIGAKGGALAYGWKWTSTGSQASIVVHEVLGTGVHDNRWNASTMTVAFTYRAVPSDDLVTSPIVLSATTAAGGEWTDGWGAYNIFVPSDDPPAGGPLELLSLAVDRIGVMPAFDFLHVPVYGYYIGEEWKEVKMSRHVETGPFPITTQKESLNVSYNPQINMNTTWRIQYGMAPNDETVTYEQHQIWEGTTMGLTFDGKIFAGSSFRGEHNYLTRTVGGGSSQPNPVNFTPGGYLTPTSWVPPTATLLGPQTGQHDSPNAGYCSVATLTLTIDTVVGWENKAWVLVIPTDDCEAVYIATHGYVSPTGASTRNTQTGRSAINFIGATRDYGAPGYPDYSPGVAYSFVPWAPIYTFGGWYGISQNLTYATPPMPPPDMYTQVFCFSPLVHGAEGVPSGSYYPLFNVDYRYPYYNGLMYTYTSAGGRYVMSEGLKFPESVNYRHRFVGWA